MDESYQIPLELALSVPGEVQSEAMVRRRGRPWCKLWGNVVRTRKLRNLGDGDFRLWVNLLAIATEYDSEGRGKLPDATSIAFILYEREDAQEIEAIERGIARLIFARLIDVDGDGEYRMHDYEQWQEGDAPSTQLPAPLTKKAMKSRDTSRSALVPADGEIRVNSKGVPLTNLQLAVEAYCRAVEMDIEIIRPNWGKYGKALTGIVNAGYTEEDIYKLTCYVASSAYWIGQGTAPPPDQVVSQAGVWKARGKPSRWTPGPRDTLGRGGIVAGLGRL